MKIDVHQNKKKVSAVPTTYLNEIYDNRHKKCRGFCKHLTTVDHVGDTRVFLYTPYHQGDSETILAEMSGAFLCK